MTLRERLNRLSIDQQRQLQYAFEQQFAQHIDLGDGHYVGVNVKSVKHLKPLEQAGTWSYGEIKKP